MGQGGFIAEARGMCHAIHVAQKVPCVTGASASSSGQPSQVSNASAESKSKRPLFKLHKYDGSTSLDTYLWKFNQLAEYLQWDERDKFYNLCASVDGPAGQVLRELSTNWTTGELEDLLQARFGTQKQPVSFQAKLRARRRAENVTLQDLHRDISRLVQLAHPRENSWFLVHVGVDSFIAALNNRDLEFDILKLEPQTLPDAVSHAIHLESLAESVSARSHTAADNTSGCVQNRQHTIFAVTDENKDKDEKATLLQRVAQLQQQLKQATQGGAHGHNAQSSSKKSNPKRGRGRKSSD